jgi:putative membrane protein
MVEEIYSGKIPDKDSEKDPEKKKKKKEEKEKEKAEKEKDRAEKEEMAAERTLLAYERTLLAWVRKGISFMTFGFAFYRLLEERAHQPGHKIILDYITPKTIGLVLIFSGFIGLLFATIRNIQVIARYGKLERKSYFQPAMLQAYLIMTISALLIIIALAGR